MSQQDNDQKDYKKEKSLGVRYIRYAPCIKLHQPAEQDVHKVTDHHIPVLSSNSWWFLGELHNS